MTYQRRHTGIAIARILLPAVLCCLLPSCKNDPETIRALTGEHSMQEDKAYGVTFLYSQEGKVSMRVFAKEFVRSPNGKRPYIDMNRGLKMEFFDDSGRVADVLTADSSRYYEVQQDFIVWDSVQIVSRKGERLNTDELIWNEQAQKFFTEKPVTITTATEVLYGDGMEANRDFTWYRILRPKGSVEVDKGEVPQ
ncbi:hypothetical protein GCM10023093_00360 [Nemorincola caseinilytica]|uniref:LPS export ABC transporter periplasmic protein LptC n=1 Tax=Nemorincola caseinilytica TaxID=2054315 RepID=A0ABP8N3V3_9BACT